MARTAPGQELGRGTVTRSAPGRRMIVALAAAAGLIVAAAALIVALAAVRLLPSLRNPFSESTSVRSQPVLLKSITALSRYQAASGSFQVIVDLTRKAAYLPSFLEGSQTLFVGQGSEIAYVNFSQLKSPAIRVSANREAVSVRLPRPQLEPAVLSVRQSYVFAQQQGLLNRIGNFFSGNPNSEHQVYVVAQQKIQAAARHSPLLAQAQRSTTAMLTGLLHSLGFQRVTVTFS
ncbi:MAG TPA: DUF4230 domain-containing protein [Streptosporangiaceae bacterium]|nr:DUF4230 domain-containing protein [Streptosporangiaceae bacterium]